jgi:hypothetical protein
VRERFACSLGWEQDAIVIAHQHSGTEWIPVG